MRATRADLANLFGADVTSIRGAEWGGVRGAVVAVPAGVGFPRHDRGLAWYHSPECAPRFAHRTTMERFAGILVRQGRRSPSGTTANGCGDRRLRTMSAEENKALVRRWFEELDKRNFAIIDELIPEDYVDHNPPLPNLPPGREGVRQSSLDPAPPSRTPSTSSRTRWPRATR